MISICTPVLDHPEFIPDFAAATIEAEVVIVDTGSTPENREKWAQVGTVIDYGVLGHNYGHWCNAGFAEATGDVIVFLNNDVRATGPWLEEVAAQVDDGAIYGPELLAQVVGGIKVPFLSGWCIAATPRTWDELWMNGGPWNTIDYPAAGYWEDNDLSLRAVMAGLELRQTKWPIQHLGNGNGTSKHKKDYYADVERNKQTFARMVRAAMSGVGHAQL